MEEDLGDIFRAQQLANFNENQICEEIASDIGDESEESIDYMLMKNTRVSGAGLDNQLPSVIAFNGSWILQVRNSAIKNIIETAGKFGYRQITVYSAVVYVDRYLSVTPIEYERFWIAELMSTACLHLASQRWEDQREATAYMAVNGLDAESIELMKRDILDRFAKIKICITPIQFTTNYFLTKFCRDYRQRNYIREKTVQIIMSILGDITLMCQKPLIVALAATLVASNTNVLSVEQIHDEIAALPQRWMIQLDDVCSCYSRLVYINQHRLFPHLTLNLSNTF